MSRPLLFQASALQGKVERDPHQQAISVPALGRVAPVVLETPETDEEMDPLPEWPRMPSQPILSPPQSKDDGDSFWPLAKLEFMEAIAMVGVNLVLAAFTWIQTGALSSAYAELWHFLLPMHFVLSWTLVMVPLALTGQSPMMGRFGLQLSAVQPERRLAFSLFHLLSVTVFPLSFICMVLTRNHRTLAELLTGQDIVVIAPARMR
ncbi:MAG: hypothetical protein H6Q00_3217 [Holophagaceae bacterium]|nr:hypothetical protein [Holophagaceae bacterium]